MTAGRGLPLGTLKPRVVLAGPSSRVRRDSRIEQARRISRVIDALWALHMTDAIELELWLQRRERKEPQGKRLRWSIGSVRSTVLDARALGVLWREEHVPGLHAVWSVRDHWLLAPPGRKKGVVRV